MRERILAVVGAIGLIVGAFFLRSVIAGDDSSSGGSGGSGSGGGRNGGDAPVVACVPDLRAVCEALVDDGAITAAPGTLELSGAAADDLAVDGWITWDPAPGVANFDRPDTWVDVEALASAPLGVLSSGAPTACAQSPTWGGCLLGAVDGGLPVGVGPGTTAQSLARLHPVARALVPPEGDFREVDATALRSSIESTQVNQSDYARQINTFLTQRGALALVVGPVPALEAAATRQTSASVVTPTPGATLTVVVATRAAGENDVSAERLLGSDAARAAFDDLGLAPGTGTVAEPTRAGEVYSVREKVG